MKIIAQYQADLDQVNERYFCTDQTNALQKVTSRNFYDSSVIDLFLPNTNTIIGQQLYSSVDSQIKSDFSICLQNIQNLLSINYNGIVGTVTFNYTVVNSEYLISPCISRVESISGVFNNIDMYVYIEKIKDTNNTLLYTLYTN
jgi:hypothetical protein